MLGLGPTELLVILAVALIVFGPNQLPEIGRAIGRGVSELRKATSEVVDVSNEMKEAVSFDNPAKGSAAKQSSSHSEQDPKPKDETAESHAQESADPKAADQG